MYKEIASVNPWSAKNKECPFDCIGCEYNDGFDTNGNELSVNCSLEDN